MTAHLDSSRLADNVAHFARVLRRAGLPVGSGKVLAAIDAAALVGVERADDFRAALAATLLDRAEQRELFDQAFRLFWRDPGPTDHGKRSPLPKVTGRLAEPSAEAQIGNRLAHALAPKPDAVGNPPSGEQTIELDAALTFSAREVLQAKDFETMSIEELGEARRMLRLLRLPLPQVITRRYAADPAGDNLDLRATLRHGIRFGGECLVQRQRKRRKRPSGLIVLCDISGSMARYSRMLLHFLHGLSAERSRVHTFTFGTRLTNITRSLRHRDVDRAMIELSRLVPDWSGGTRIGTCLREFNLHWSRRLLGQGSVVLIISDGLDSGEGPGLDAQMARLRASCRQILWLNPLLRFEGFQPRAAGIRSMLPYVDHFLPAHNIESLEQLGRVFATLPTHSRPHPARGPALSWHNGSGSTPVQGTR